MKHLFKKIILTSFLLLIFIPLCFSGSYQQNGSVAGISCTARGQVRYTGYVYAMGTVSSSAGATIDFLSTEGWLYREDTWHCVWTDYVSAENTTSVQASSGWIQIGPIAAWLHGHHAFVEGSSTWGCEGGTY